MTKELSRSEPQRPEALPEEAWEQMRYELRDPISNDALMRYAAVFEEVRRLSNQKAAEKWAFEQVPDPRMPKGMPVSAWRMMRASLSFRTRYAGLEYFGAVFEDMREKVGERFGTRVGEHTAKAWARWHAANRRVPRTARLALWVLRNFGGTPLT